MFSNHEEHYFYCCSECFSIFLWLLYILCSNSTNFVWYSVAMKILFIINIIRVSIVAEKHKMVKTAAYFDILLLLTESAAFYEIQAWILIISRGLQWRNFNAFTKIWQTFNFPEYRILIYTRNQKMQYLRWSRTVEYKPENDHVSQWKLQSSQ